MRNLDRDGLHAAARSREAVAVGQRGGEHNGLTDSLSTIAPNGEATFTLADNGTGGAGTATYTFTLADANVTPQTVTLTVGRVGLTAQGLYVTQGTEPDFGVLVPSGTGQSGSAFAGETLVANKKTVVRLYADATGSPAVSGLLYGYEGGRALPGSPLTPDYGPLNASGIPESTLPPAGAQVNEIVPDSEIESNANAFTFTLPNSWTEATPQWAPSSSSDRCNRPAARSSRDATPGTASRSTTSPSTMSARTRPR